jgi:hypothetical protein
MYEAREVIRQFGMRLIRETRTALLHKPHDTDETVGLRKNDVKGNDILSSLLKANLAVDLREDLRLTDDELVARTCLMH